MAVRPARASAVRRCVVPALNLTCAAPATRAQVYCDLMERMLGKRRPSQARGTPPLSPHALVSSFAHALVRDAPCALADAARADKLGEERALHPRVRRWRWSAAARSRAAA